MKSTAGPVDWLTDTMMQAEVLRAKQGLHLQGFLIDRVAMGKIGFTVFGDWPDGMHAFYVFTMSSPFDVRMN